MVTPWREKTSVALSKELNHLTCSSWHRMCLTATSKNEFLTLIWNVLATPRMMTPGDRIRIASSIARFTPGILLSVCSVISRDAKSVECKHSQKKGSDQTKAVEEAAHAFIHTLVSDSCTHLFLQFIKQLTVMENEGQRPECDLQEDKCPATHAPQVKRSWRFSPNLSQHTGMAFASAAHMISIPKLAELDGTTRFFRVSKSVWNTKIKFCLSKGKNCESAQSYRLESHAKSGSVENIPASRLPHFWTISVCQCLLQLVSSSARATILTCSNLWNYQWSFGIINKNATHKKRVVYTNVCSSSLII